MENFNEDQIKELAKELRSPSGNEICDIMEETNSNMILKTMDLLEIDSNSVVLELGPGNGFHLRPLLEKNYQLVVADISKYVLDSLKEKYSDYKIETVLTDGLVLDITESSISTGFSVNTLYFWEEPKSYLKEICKCFKKGGEFYLTFAHKESVKDMPFTKYGFELYDEKALEKLCSNSGFYLSSMTNVTEVIKSKIGENVQRDFIIAKLVKS